FPPRFILCPPRSGGRFLPPEFAEAGGRGQQSEMGLPLPPTPLRGGPFPPRFAPGDKAPGDKAPGDKDFWLLVSGLVVEAAEDHGGAGGDREGAFRRGRLVEEAVAGGVDQHLPAAPQRGRDLPV